MEKTTTITAIIDLWPTRSALAEDIHVTTDRVHKWAQKASIPARYHFAILEAARVRGFDVDAELLTRVHAIPPVPPVLSAAE